MDAWHHEVVRPLRAVRQHLKSGPPPAPNDITARLRSQIQQIEIAAEMIELDQLAALIPMLEPTPRSTIGTAKLSTRSRALCPNKSTPDSGGRLRAWGAFDV